MTCRLALANARILGWFKGLDFQTLHLQTPPFIPELRSPGDTRYFEDDIKPEPLGKVYCEVGGKNAKCQI